MHSFVSMRRFILSLCVLVCIFSKRVDSISTPIIQDSGIECGFIPDPWEIIQANSSLHHLNQTHFEVKYRLFPEKCIFASEITEIQIEVGADSTPSLCISEDNINLAEYQLTVKFNNLNRNIRIDRDQVTGVSRSNRTVLIKIFPILADEIYISRFINTTGTFCTRYGIVGKSSPRISVLSYLMSLPGLNLNGDGGKDDTYSGWCNGIFCYGGKGQLMDGHIGNGDDNSNSFSTVSWRCNSDGLSADISCIYELQVILTGTANITRIVFNGYNTRTEILPPQIQIEFPNITNNCLLKNLTTVTYEIKCPINRFVERIDIRMIVMEKKELVLSEVQVVSEGFNLGPLDIGYIYTIGNVSTQTTTTMATPTTTTTTMATPATTTTMATPTTTTTMATPTTTYTATEDDETNTTKDPSANFNNYCNDEILYIVFSLIIVIQFILLLFTFAGCIYSTRKYRVIKKTEPLSNINNKKRNESQYSTAPSQHNPIYASIDLETETNTSHGSGVKGASYRQQIFHESHCNYTINRLNENPMYSVDHSTNNTSIEELIRPESPKRNTLTESISNFNMKNNELYTARDPTPSVTVYSQMGTNGDGNTGDLSAYDVTNHK